MNVCLDTMNTWELPNEARHYLLLQKTEYQKENVLKILCKRLGLVNAYCRHLLPHVDTNSIQILSNLYYSDMKEEYHKMEPHIPDDVENVLDIGCGLGGINIFFSSHYNGDVNHYLLDKTEISKIFYGFSQTAAAYNSLNVTKEFLTSNGIDDERLATIDIRSDEFPTDTDFDLIISLKSWGFHYPVMTYLNEVKNALKEDGKLIVDIRKGTNGLYILDNNFDQIDIITNSRKYVRVSARLRT